MKTEIKVRKNWSGFNPVERIHGEGKQGFKQKYSKRDRKDWKRELEY